MAGVRAFVGHSFAEEDSDVVGKILKYLDQIKQNLPGFAWENAEPSQPLDLAAKVKSIIADKNVCIAICTRKERVVQQDKIFKPWFLRSASAIRDEDLQWKTSDWVIQEIGLAIGREMDLIILVEKGVRLPGGLQGNIEYIEFERTSPEKMSGKLLQMIGSLQPQAGSISIGSPEAPPTETVEKEPKSEFGLPNISSKWVRSDFNLAIFHALIHDRAEDIEEIYQAFLRTSEGANPESAASFRSFIEGTKITFGKDGNLEKLRSLADSHTENCEVLSNLAAAYGSYREFDSAGEQYKAAAQVAPTISRKIELLGEASVQFIKAQNPTESRKLIENLRESGFPDPKSESGFLKALIEIADHTNDDDLAISAMERIVELFPDDIGTRFSLAYKHSENKNDELALFHYVKIPYSQRNSSTWNNLGVQYERIRAPGRAVSAYKAAADEGETLAMSNLAYKLMNTGFLEEAEKEFDRALQNKDPHKNANTGMAALKDVPDNETKIVEEAVEKVTPKANFFTEFARALSKPTPHALPSILLGPQCELSVTIEGDSFRAVGSYERPSNPLANAFGGGASAKENFLVRYEGKLIGGQIVGFVEHKNLDTKRTAASVLELEGKTKFLMFFDGKTERAKVMERPNSSSPTFYSLSFAA